MGEDRFHLEGSHVELTEAELSNVPAGEKNISGLHLQLVDGESTSKGHKGEIDISGC